MKLNPIYATLMLTTIIGMSMGFSLPFFTNVTYDYMTDEGWINSKTIFHDGPLTTYGISVVTDHESVFARVHSRYVFENYTIGQVVTIYRHAKSVWVDESTHGTLLYELGVSP